MKHFLKVTSLAFLLVAPAATAPADDSAKPVIGINVWLATQDTTNVSMSVRSTYVDAVVEAGGIPVVLPAVEDEAVIRQYVQMMDGFIFAGGRDLNPALYGQEQHESVVTENVRREAFDLELMRQVLDAEKPILGICLGMQQMNVVRGGTLIQDIPSFTDVDEDHRPADVPGTHLAHDVLIDEDSILHSLIGESTLTVNSLHHQACGDLGDGILVTGRSPEGIVEAIEIPDYPFALGVQWHPEMLYDVDSSHHTLFRALIEAAKGNDPLAWMAEAEVQLDQ